ncbi:geranylgeranyl reductase family protein [Mycobacterium sp. 852002-40037_SCH5390672]|uniref:geranylgeranyl reductase family protein n=1 Tax=Mycobacterium sp. 852002-40037_SCH5390672 TaxID=1834089 RepID=UPI000805156E|nr:geranylgeranyl reductase family protein [Mycobacterium sp. 852002-40037_SCH5390672]OBB89970.1 FAD-linked oxidoreductase [Mycobacterium sp. 852002-40037_SCH5390672]
MMSTAELIVVGAGPGGSAAAAWAARQGREVLVIDAAEFPRDKACGDAVSPRAMGELEKLGLGDWLDGRIRHRGLRMSGFGTQVEVAWPTGSFPPTSTAIRRTELDDRIRCVAADEGAKMMLGTKVVTITQDRAGRVLSVTTDSGAEIRCERLIVADGAKSPIGRQLGRVWYRKWAYGVAIRGYLTSERGDEPWVSSHVLHSPEGKLLPGYGWIFPLGNGTVNIGVGTLAALRRPADTALRPLLSLYTSMCQQQWGFEGQPLGRMSSLLPMGGSVGGCAGPNWMLVGDAAACVNPLNGEGIDYALETGRVAAEHLELPDLTMEWPETLQRRYGREFSVARRLAYLLTTPAILSALGPVGMRSKKLMDIGVRAMGNLISDDDEDWVAWMWRRAGALSRRFDSRAPFAG